MIMDVTGAIPGMVTPGYYNGSNNSADIDAILRGIGDARMETKESEAVILRTISKEVSDSTFRLHENIRNVADQILVSSNLTQSQLAASTSALLLAGERQTATILSSLQATEMRQLQDELNEARHERSRWQGQVQALNTAINFGSGSTGALTSTATNNTVS